MNIKLGTFMQVPLFINVFTIILALIFYAYDIMVFGVFLISLVFVVMHEYGHCYAAQKVNWKVKDIIIFPFGGFARINPGYKYNANEELFVVAAGPAVNFTLAFIYSLALISYLIVWEFDFSILFGLIFVITVNLMMAVFNLLPVFPMDGGRIFRALLSKAIGLYDATWWVIKISQGLGFALSVLCFIYGFYMAGFIFIFMAIYSQRDLAMAKLITLIEGLKIKAANLLNKPELATAEISVILAEIEKVEEDEDFKEKLQIEDLKEIFKEIASDKLT